MQRLPSRNEFDSLGGGTNKPSVIRGNHWSSYQELEQNLQQPQPAFFSQSPQCPTPAAPPLAIDAAWQTATSSRTQPEPDFGTTTTKKKVTISVKQVPQPHRSSTVQHRTKGARVKAGSEPSPVTSISYVKGNNDSEDSNLSQALQGPERKKRHRIKNQAAAKRCRKKTKHYKTDLANKEKQVTQERMYLDACVTALKNEPLGLRS
ncbi:bZIP transcription factor [Colletotrichum tofieldiae]|uniref:BZIP transcription factor n=1 Tax=Colletotrichum tofieldiae TaxID=708197 RepID=A0A166ZC33_9PEZI|nr:bZIP transcription factor [Colletotrichum tofieldiae]